MFRKLLFIALSVTSINSYCSWKQLSEQIFKAFEIEFKELPDDFKEIKPWESHFVQEHSDQIVDELKLIVKEVLNICLESQMIVVNTQRTILEGLEENRINSFEDLLAALETSCKELIENCQMFLAQDHNDIKLFSELMSRISKIVSAHKEKAFMRLRSIEPVTLNETMKNELAEACNKYDLTPEKIDKLRNLLNSPSYEMIFACFKPVLKQSPDLNNIEKIDASVKANLVFALIAFGLQACAIVNE